MVPNHEIFSRKKELNQSNMAVSLSQSEGILRTGRIEGSGETEDYNSSRNGNVHDSRLLQPCMLAPQFLVCLGISILCRVSATTRLTSSSPPS